MCSYEYITTKKNYAETLPDLFKKLESVARYTITLNPELPYPYYGEITYCESPSENFVPYSKNTDIFAENYITSTPHTRALFDCMTDLLEFFSLHYGLTFARGDIVYMYTDTVFKYCIPKWIMTTARMKQINTHFSNTYPDASPNLDIYDATYTYSFKITLPDNTTNITDISSKTLIPRLSPTNKHYEHIFKKMHYFNLSLHYRNDKLRVSKPANWEYSTYDNPYCIISKNISPSVRDDEIKNGIDAEKMLRNPFLYESFTAIQNETTNNAYGLLTKQRVKQGYLICINIDNNAAEYDENNVLLRENGLDTWDKLCENRNYESNTTVERTDTGGYHYYFYVSEERKDMIRTYNGLVINGKMTNIDVKYNYSMVICAPSMYVKDGKRYGYAFESLDFDNLEELPNWMFTIILEQDVTRSMGKDIGKRTYEYDVTHVERDIIIEGIRLLPGYCCENEDQWLTIGTLCYLYGIDLRVWEHWSIVGNRKPIDCVKHWRYTVRGTSYTIDITELVKMVYTFLSRDVADGWYAKFKGNAYFGKICKSAGNNVGIITLADIFDDGRTYAQRDINSKYLTYKDAGIIRYPMPKNDIEHMSNYASDFIENKKGLIIRSGPGSGRTQTMLNIINKGNYKRILFVTHRNKSERMPNNVFNNVFNYVDITDSGNFVVDRAIINPENLHKIFDTNHKKGGSLDLIKYDLVVLDEIESLLYHFNDCADAMTNYLFLHRICINSNKVLAIDSDVCQRSLYFIDTVTSQNFIYVKNSYEDKKTYNVYEDRVQFENEIVYDNIKGGKKIYMFCMETDALQYYAKRIKVMKDKLVIREVCGVDVFKNSSTEWLRYDVLLTTNVGKKGVNFDPEMHDGNRICHFDKICGSIGKGYLPRQLNQEMRRMRNPTDDEHYYLHNGGYEYRMNCPFMTYGDVLKTGRCSILYQCVTDGSSAMQDYIENCGFMGGCSNRYQGVTNDRTAMRDYIENCRFNEVEEINKDKNFIKYFELLVRDHGGVFNYVKAGAKD